MVLRSMRNGLRVADEVYIKRVLFVLEDFLFYSLYLFTGIAKQVTTLKQVQLLFCFDFLEMNIESFVLFGYYITVTNITYARCCPLQLGGYPNLLLTLITVQRGRCCLYT
jgi:hypothetical protein